MAPVIEILNESIGPPDSPSDCALAIALPLEREAFQRQLEEGPDGNFARSVRGPERLRLTNQAVYVMYEKYAMLANRVIQDAESLGVTVATNARLSHLATMLRTHRVTTIIAHSRDAHFSESDITAPTLIAAELRRDSSAIRRTINELSGPEPDNLGEGKTGLVEYLNRIVDGIHEDGSAEGRAGQLTRTHLTWSRRRTALQHSLPTAFEGGNAIEFSDGFVPIGTIVDTIPPTFQGKLDLTSCNSTVFAEAVRKKCKSVLVIANEDSTSLDLRLAIYRQVIRRLSRRSEPYEDALYQVRKELL
jgi:hypothetical protein